MVIGVPSAFDTNIYTTSSHTSGCSETHPPIPTPFPPVHERKLQSVRFVTASTKTSLNKGRRGVEEERGGRKRKSEAASSVSSEIGVTGSPEPFSPSKTES